MFQRVKAQTVAAAGGRASTRKARLPSRCTSGPAQAASTKWLTMSAITGECPGRAAGHPE
ncbi:hypothetical protein SMICM304S_01739 [Streptomyces microflavus]